jgi:hypothetical protein
MVALKFCDDLDAKQELQILHGYCENDGIVDLYDYIEIPPANITILVLAYHNPKLFVPKSKTSLINFMRQSTKVSFDILFH